MKNAQVSYTVKPENVTEHLSLVTAVFRWLHHSGIRDMKYGCYQTAEHTFYILSNSLTRRPVKRLLIFGHSESFRST